MKTIYDYANMIFSTVIKSLFDGNLDVARKAGSILINVSAEKRGAEVLLSSEATNSNVSHVIQIFLEFLSFMIRVLLFKINIVLEYL